MLPDGQPLVYYPGKQTTYENFSLDANFIPRVPSNKLPADLVLGGLGAHIVALDQYEPTFHTRLASYKEQVSSLLSQALKLKENGLVNMYWKILRTVSMYCTVK